MVCYILDMILSASSRTDVPAFYMEWFIGRLKAGFFDVRNPFYPKKVSRIYMKNVDAIMFCTKNPLPLEKYLNQIPVPIFLDVTITPYHKDIEPNVPNKKEVIACVQRISGEIGKEFVAVRYDPIFINDQYTISYHKKAFERLCALLEGYVEEVSISLLDLYKNVKANADKLRLKEVTEEDLKELGSSFSQTGKKYGIKVFTCHEKGVLASYGIEEGVCFSPERAFEMTGKQFKTWKARDCGCVEMVDIGFYNSCKHLCAYCYANYDQRKVMKNYESHDKESSLLIGHLSSQDEIKERKK